LLQARHGSKGQIAMSGRDRPVMGTAFATWPLRHTACLLGYHPQISTRLGMGTSMKTSHMFIAMLLTLSAGVSHATEQAVTTTITRVMGSGAGTFFINLATNSPSCTNTSNPVRYNAAVSQAGVTSDGLKMMYAAALYAMSAGKQVAVHFDDASSNCWVTRLWVID